MIGRCATSHKKGSEQMEYRIRIADTPGSLSANGRKDLLEWLKLLKDETITEISKIYCNGVEEPVIEKYRQFIR